MPEWRCFKTKREIPATEFQRLTKSDWVKTALRQRHSSHDISVDGSSRKVDNKVR
jgi:hypothetical protein